MRGSTILTLFLFVTLALSVPPPPKKLPSTEALFLGTVEGKSYLADNAVPRSWNEAKTFCTSIGMRLASVETAAQKNFLAGVEDSRFQSFYWTAGRDAKSPQQFVWDHNSVSVAANFDSLSSYLDFKACVLYNSRNNKYESYYCERSASLNGEFGKLCESIN